MRLRVAIATSASELPWKSVLAPGRGVTYDLLATTAEELGARLHEKGWGPHGMAPFGYGALSSPALLVDAESTPQAGMGSGSSAALSWRWWKGGPPP